MLTSTLIFEQLWCTRPPYLPGVEHSCTQGRRNIFYLNALKISLALTSQAGPFQVMCLGTQHVDEQKELNTCSLKSQNATTITSALTHPVFLGQWRRFW